MTTTVIQATFTALILILATVTTVLSRPAVNEECSVVMRDAGLSDNFASLVAHRIHSLTTEDLRYYFKPDVTEDNNVPTVNFNLSSPYRVLDHAPLYGYDTSFATVGLQHLDMVLRTMDRDNWGLTGYNTLELITHSFHMAEMWFKLQPIYREFEKSPPSKEVCSCVTDKERNGLLQNLQLLALEIKYPGITSGDYEESDEEKERSEILKKRRASVEEEAGVYRSNVQKRDVDAVYREATGVGKRDADGVYKEATGVRKRDVDGVYNQVQKVGKRDVDGVYKEATGVGKRNVDGVYSLVRKVGKRDVDGVYNQVQKVGKRDADAVYKEATGVRKRDVDGAYKEATGVGKRNVDGVYKEATGVGKRDVDGVYNQVQKVGKRDVDGVYTPGRKVGKRDADHSSDLEFLGIVNDDDLLEDFDFTGNEEDIVSRASAELVDGTEAIALRLVDEKGWAAWRDDIKEMDEAGQYESAMFLYCTLNDK